MPPNLTSLITPNAISHVSERDELTLGSNAVASQSPSPQILIFFISGNPGLISYYEEFLRLIAAPYLWHSKQDARAGDSHGEDQLRGSQHRNVTVAGLSLGGFEVSPASQSSQSSSQGVSEVSQPRSSDTDESTDRSLLEKSLLYPSGFKQKPNGNVYTLREQIELCYARLEHLVQLMSPSEARNSDTTSSSPVSSSTLDSHRTVEVVLVGHSVGAHIALEMTRIHHSRHFTSSSTTSTVSATTVSTTTVPSFTIKSSILLTPTILNIAHSPSGLIATPLLTYVSFLPGLMQLLASNLTSIVYSHSWLSWLVSRVTGMETGSKALATTVAFLGTKGAVRQALAMAKDEMKEIAGDVWEGRDGDDEVDLWGLKQATKKTVRDESDSSQTSSTTSTPNTVIENTSSKKSPTRATWIPPRLFLLFAQTDHWVAESTRSEILAALMPNENGSDPAITHTEASSAALSAKSRTAPVVVVDEKEGLVHAWCLRQSAQVAEQVRGWIAELLDSR